MDNLINFDDESESAAETLKINDDRPNSPLLLLIPQRSKAKAMPIQMSVDLSNPCEKAEFQAMNAGDPFECLEFLPANKQDSGNNSSLHLQDGSLFSFDCFSNVSSIDSSHITLSSESSKNSSATSKDSGKTVVSRSQSDSSTISSKSDLAPAVNNNRSLDTATAKHQQLLKLSFYNSPNSPMKNSSTFSSSFAENVSLEAKKIAKRFAEAGDLSFEDLEDISQNLVDASNDSFKCDEDLKDMKVNVFSAKSQPPQTPSADKIALFQEKLNRIKKEVDSDAEVIDLSVDIKEENLTPVPIVKTERGDGDSGAKSSELDGILSKLKSVFSEGNKDEAKKQLNRLNELLGNQQQEPKNTLYVQPIIRQDTFEIDEKTGKRKYNSNPEPTQKTEKDDIMEKLAMLLGTQSLDVHSAGKTAAGGNIVVFMQNSAPAPSSTPQKNPSRQSIAGIRLKTQSAFKAPEEKRSSATPMKHPAPSRLSSFTTPRPSLQGSSKTPHPYEQKLSMQSRAGAVRKSLMASMEKSPQIPKAKAPAGIPPPRHATARRSVSMKAAIPAVQVTKSSPMKSTTPRPSTGATTANRRLSTASAPFVRPLTRAPAASASKTRPTTRASSQFKPPSGVRRSTVFDKDSLV